MALHPWVSHDHGPLRIGTLVTGARGRDAEGRFPLYEQAIQRMVTTARAADSLDYDAIFVGDHPTILPDPFISLTAIASITTRIRIGTLVSVPSFRHPTMLARLASDVDHLSGGRLILGLGIGQVEADFQALGIPFPSMPERRRHLAETIRAMESIWRHESPLYRGSQIPVETIQSISAPLQQPRPPFVIAGAGERTLRLVAKYADACNLAGPWGAVTPDDIRARLTTLDRACHQFGRDPREILRTYIAVIVVAADEERLEAKLARLFPRDFLEQRMRIGYIAAGTPERMVMYFRGLIEAGIQYVVVHLADTADEETLELLASDVMPRL